MFLFNRSVLSVCLALLIAGLPVLIQYFWISPSATTAGSGRLPERGLRVRSSATVASTSNAAPALWAVPSHSGQPFQMRFIPIAI